MTGSPAACHSALEEMIRGLIDYLVSAQESEGQFAGSFWSELAYHIPHLDYRAGGSHHNRTVGSAALAFIKRAEVSPHHDLRERAIRAFDWVVTRQHEDGGLFEITNNDRPSQFHLDYERSSISLGIVTHGMCGCMQRSLPTKEAWLQFLRKAAHWQLTVETDPGNFLHTEGYPEDKLILNASAHAAETLLVGMAVAENRRDRVAFRKGAARAVDAIIALQRDNGMFPYSNYEGDNSVSYTATVAWVLQNLLDQRSLPMDLRDEVTGPIERAAAFLAEQVNDDGSIAWEPWENHGQKYHTWVYALMARALAWHDNEDYHDAAARLVSFVHRELFDRETGLPRLYDFPIGEERTICGKTVRAEGFFRCAYHQADLLDCLVDVQRLLR
ncbi:MAG: prenyltransferase/squalene oxidase repeat-containing protein [Armatimonadota bacterium]